MSDNVSRRDKIVARSEALGRKLHSDDQRGPLNYVSSPGGGEQPRYVFDERVCVGAAAAEAYLSELEAAAAQRERDQGAGQ